MNSSSKQYAIIGIGMCIVDNILEYDDSPSLGDEIRKKLAYHTHTNEEELLNNIYTFEKTARNLGGSTSNTIRIVNKIFNNKVYFIGSVGNGSNANFIKEQLTKEGVNFDLFTSSTRPTSTVIVLVEKKERNLFANVGASADISVDFFKKNYNNLANSSVIYSDAYLVDYVYDAYAYVYPTFANDNKILLGLGFADYEILLNYYPKLSKVLPYCDILFMNKKEFVTWVAMSNKNKGNDDSDTNSQIITEDNFEQYVSLFLDKKSLEKLNKNKTFIVVITQGKKESIIYWRDYKEEKSFINKEPRWDYEESSVIDTTGVGDSFAGGFLSGLILGKPYNECAMIGHYIASKVLQKKGFQVPDISISEIEQALQSRTLKNKSTKDDL